MSSAVKLFVFPSFIYPSTLFCFRVIFQRLSFFTSFWRFFSKLSSNLIAFKKHKKRVKLRSLIFLNFFQDFLDLDFAFLASYAPADDAFCWLFGTLKRLSIWLEFDLLFGLNFECHFAVWRLGHDQHILKFDHVLLLVIRLRFLICYSTLHFFLMCCHGSTKHSFDHCVNLQKSWKVLKMAKKWEFLWKICLHFQMGLTLTFR